MDKILFPIEWVVAWIMTIFHQIFTAMGMPADGGWTWVLAIAFLTIVVRAILIPLFVYQIKAQRKMQLMQPEIQKLQAKYKGKKDQFSRQQMAEEQQALFKKHGTNPFASCLPLLVQMPIFFSLFRVIRYTKEIAEGHHAPIGGLTHELAQQAEASTLFGIFRLSDTFMSDGVLIKIFTAILIVAMSAMQFFTQKQMMSKNMSEAALNNPFMQQQKMLLYLMPVIFAVGGIYFPLGVLVYWVVSNGWTMGQQMMVLRTMPTPGSKAEKELLARRAKKGKGIVPGVTSGDAATGGDQDAEDSHKPSGQRQQPMSKARQKKNKK
jgi:YidC/Oxa1 family membrane protein insertase